VADQGLDPRTSFAASQGTWTSAAVVFVGNVVARGLGFLFPVVIARATGKSDFALVYFFVNTGFFVGELVLAGFPTALTRYLAAPGNVGRGTWLLTSWVAGIPLLAISLVAGVAFAIRGDASPALLGMVIVGLTIDAYYFGALRGLHRFGLLVAYRVGANLAQILIVLFTWQVGLATVPVIVAIYSMSYLIPMALIEWRAAPVRSLWYRVSWPTPSYMRDMAQFGIPAVVSGVAYAAIVGLDVFWVRILAPDSLAVYGAARTLAMPMSLVSFAISVVLMPKVAIAKGEERGRLLVQGLATTAGVGFAAVVGYLLLSDPVVGFVYPPAFGDAAGLLPLLATAMGMMGFYSVLSQWWMGTGRATIPATTLVVGAITSCVAHASLDATLGATGAAIAMALGAATSIVALGLATLRDRMLYRGPVAPGSVEG